MNNVKRLAVYCGSAAGSDPLFADATRATAAAMVGQGVDLVYGVIPAALVDLEVAHTGVTELFRVANMHERKAKMTDLADAFVCLPGGIGTLDEMFEAWTWNALGYHAQPFCLLNVHGFWDGLAGFMDHVVESGFLSEARRLQLLKADTPAQALDLLDEALKSAAQGVTW